MAPGGPGTRHMTLRASVPPATQGAMSTPDLAASVVCGVAATATDILERFTWSPLVNEADRPPVDQAADMALRERLQRHLAATPWSTPTGQAAPGRTSAFDHLGRRAPAPQHEEQWAPQPEMTPPKVDRERQPNRGGEKDPPWATSQKWCSQSRPRDKVDSKKGRTEGDGKSGKVQVGIDWANMGIRKPVSRPDSQHPSFRPDTSRTSGDPPPRTKSTVAQVLQKQVSSRSPGQGWQSGGEGISYLFDRPRQVSG